MPDSGARSPARRRRGGAFPSGCDPFRVGGGRPDDHRDGLRGAQGPPDRTARSPWRSRGIPPHAPFRWRPTLAGFRAMLVPRRRRGSRDGASAALPRGGSIRRPRAAPCRSRSAEFLRPARAETPQRGPSAALDTRCASVLSMPRPERRGQSTPQGRPDSGEREAAPDERFPWSLRPGAPDAETKGMARGRRGDVSAHQKTPWATDGQNGTPTARDRTYMVKEGATWVSGRPHR